MQATVSEKTGATSETKPQGEERPLIAIIRIRGRTGVPPDVEYTLNLLRLTRKFTMSIYPEETHGLKGMLQVVKDWVTWGEIDRDTLVELLKKRGRAPGNKRLTEEYLKEKLGVNSFEELADKLFKREILLHKIKDVIKPVFRLAPPRKGFKKSTKRPYQDQGELGYRGRAINELIRRMM